MHTDIVFQGKNDTLRASSLKYRASLPKRKVVFLPKSELFLSFSQKVRFKRVFVLKSMFLVGFFISKASFLQKKWDFFFKSVQKASFFTKEVGLSTWEVSCLRRSRSFV